MSVLAAFPPLVLDWIPPRELTPNGRAHWGTKAKLTKQVRFLGAAKARSMDWPKQMKGGPRRRITITMRRPRRLDPDAAAMSYKAFIDGLADAGVLLTDSPVNLDLVVLQELGKPRTVVILEEIQP